MWYPDSPRTCQGRNEHGIHQQKLFQWKLVWRVRCAKHGWPWRYWRGLFSYSYNEIGKTVSLHLTETLTHSSCLGRRPVSNQQIQCGSIRRNWWYCGLPRVSYAGCRFSLWSGVAEVCPFAWFARIYQVGFPPPSFFHGPFQISRAANFPQASMGWCEQGGTSYGWHMATCYLGD